MRARAPPAAASARTAPMEPPRDVAAENAARDGETDPEALLREYYVTESCAERQGNLLWKAHWQMTCSAVFKMLYST